MNDSHVSNRNGRLRFGFGVTVAMIAAVTLAAVTLLPALTPSASAYPEPAIVTSAWEFEFKYDMPKLVSIEAVDGSIQWFWFMTYQVENNTGQERLFIPDIIVADDEGRIHPAGSGVPASVFPKIKKLVGNKLLESPVSVIGKVLQGEEHAKDSVAIWPAPPTSADAMSVFIGGLSGETASMNHPETGDKIVLRKTLMLEFALPGNPLSNQAQVIKLSNREWIMR